MLSKSDREAFRRSGSLATGVSERDRSGHNRSSASRKPDQRQESLSRWQLLGTTPKCLRNAVEKFAGLA
jgi:hypothetical protein